MISSIYVLYKYFEHTLRVSSIHTIFFSSYNVWKHVRYHVLISRYPGVITQFR